MATDKYGYCLSTRKWIIATALEEGIIAMLNGTNGTRFC